MAAGSIIVDLLMRTGAFETDSGRAAKLAEKRAKEIQKSFERAGAGVRDAFTGLFAGLTVGAAVAGFKAVVNQLDALNDVADATGASIENISALEDIGRRTGAGIETVETALVKLNQALNTAADPKSSAAAALDAIGLSAKELSTLDPAQALLKVAQALDGYADDGNKARLMQELLGKSMKELAPFLHDLAEKGQLNATVTGEQARQAEAFNKQVFELQTNISNAARNMALELVPALDEVAKFTLEAQNKFGPFLGLLAGIGGAVYHGFGGQLDELKRAESEVGELFARRSAAIKQVQELEATASGAVYASTRDAALQELGQARADLDGVTAELKTATASRDKLLAARRTGGKEPPKPGLEFSPFNPATPKAPRAPKEYDAGFEMQRRAADAYAATLGKIVDAQAAANDSTLTLTPSQKALRDLMADPVWQAMPEPWKQTAIAQTEAAVATEKLVADMDRLTALLDATPTAQLDKQRDTMQFLADAFERGAISAEQFSEAAMTALGELPQRIDEVTDRMTVFADQAARNMQDAFADFLFDPFNDGLEGMARSFAQTLQRMASQMLAAKIFETIGGVLKGSDTGWVSSLGGSLLKSVAGARADGGPVGAGQTYLVGERGPELFTPSTAGAVLPNDLLGRAAGGGAPVVNIRNVNAFDTSVISDFMGSDPGERLVINAVKRNPGLIKQLAGS